MANWNINGDIEAIGFPSGNPTAGNIVGAHILSYGGGYSLLPIDINSIGDNYIRYNNGIQICWGVNFQNGYNTRNVVINFPVAFVNTDYAFFSQMIFNDDASGHYIPEYTSNTSSEANQRTTSSVRMLGTVSRSYFVIGYWK